MISIISTADGVLRDRAAALKIEKGRIVVVGSHRSYDASLYSMVDADSTAFQIEAGRWNGVAWEAYPLPVPPAPPFPSEAEGLKNYYALMRRRADALEASGDLIGAMNIRISIGV